MHDQPEEQSSRIATSMRATGPSRAFCAAARYGSAPATARAASAIDIPASAAP